MGVGRTKLKNYNCGVDAMNYLSVKIFDLMQICNMIEEYDRFSKEASNIITDERKYNLKKQTKIFATISFSNNHVTIKVSVNDVRYGYITTISLDVDMIVKPKKLTHVSFQDCLEWFNEDEKLKSEYKLAKKNLRKKVPKALVEKIFEK